MKTCFRRFIYLAAMTASAQTQINLANQGRNFDFSGAAVTRPVKTGTMLPSSCTTGDMFLNSGSPAGSNLYACIGGAWTLQSVQSPVTVEASGTTVGARPVQNFTPGTGFVQILSDTGQQINVQESIDTAIVETKASNQAGTSLLCASSSGSATTYACSMTPTLSVYAVGMVVHWVPDISCAPGPITLNIDTLGALMILESDGQTLSSAIDCTAGRVLQLAYDGANLRIIGGSPTGATGAPGQPGPAGPPGAAGSIGSADNISGILQCAAQSGSGTAYSCSTSPSFMPAAHDMVLFLADVSNSGPATLNVNASANAPVQKQGGAIDLIAGDLLAGQWVLLIYDGAKWQMQGQTGNEPAAGGSYYSFARDWVGIGPVVWITEGSGPGTPGCNGGASDICWFTWNYGGGLAGWVRYDTVLPPSWSSGKMTLHVQLGDSGFGGTFQVAAQAGCNILTGGSYSAPVPLPSITTSGNWTVHDVSANNISLPGSCTPGSLLSLKFTRIDGVSADLRVYGHYGWISLP